MYDTTLGWRFTNPRLAEMHYPYSMGETGRERGRALDRSAARTRTRSRSCRQQRAVAAIEAGRFADQIVPVMVPQAKGEPIEVDRDEHPRADTRIEALAQAAPAFREGGTVTAGNSSASTTARRPRVVDAERWPASAGLKPLARVVSTAVAGVDPAVMGLGPIPATRKALERAGLTVDDLDLIELNEAFASQSLACMRELGLDPEKVNVNGGAIALGHPLGMSGARLITMLRHELRRTGKRYGLATMCIGVGQGIATIIERLDR